MKKLSLVAAVLLVGTSLFAQDGTKKETPVKKEERNEKKEHNKK